MFWQMIIPDRKIKRERERERHGKSAKCELNCRQYSLIGVEFDLWQVNISLVDFWNTSKCWSATHFYNLENKPGICIFSTFLINILQEQRRRRAARNYLNHPEPQQLSPQTLQGKQRKFTVFKSEALFFIFLLLILDFMWPITGTLWSKLWI